MRRLLALTALIGVTACTPQQLAAWVDWHTVDPAAAIAYANTPEVQQQLASAVPAPGAPPSGRGGVWDRLAWCEAGGNWATNTANGYSGGLQFTHDAWNAYGGREYAARAWQASREAQIVVAERILADVGWRAWPACSRKLGLR